MLTRPRLIPCLLLDRDRLVKTVAFRRPRYLGDPLNAARIFNDKAADELMVLDITATDEGRPPNLALIGQLASECFMPLTYGGGIGELTQIRAILRLGVEKVVLGTAAAERPGLLAQAAATFGAQSLCVAIDVRRRLLGGEAVTVRRGRRIIARDAVAWARRLAGEGAGEILLTRIEREGGMQGYDLDLVARVAAAVEIPVIAHGGAGRQEHLAEAILRAGAAGAAAGSLFVYQGRPRAVLLSYVNDADFARLFPPAALPAGSG